MSPSWTYSHLENGAIDAIPGTQPEALESWRYAVERKYRPRRDRSGRAMSCASRRCGIAVLPNKTADTAYR